MIKKFALVSVLLASLTACKTTVPVRDFNNNLVPTTNQTLTQSDVAKAILKACVQLGWQCQKLESGKIAGQLNIRSHQLMVDINYNAKTYDIQYKDSVNLKYNGKKIHRQYVNWVNNLIRHTNAELI